MGLLWRGTLVRVPMDDFATEIRKEGFMRKQIVGLVTAALMVFILRGGEVLGAEVFPNKPLELIVPYSAGGSTDVMCRTLVARAAPFLNNQPVIIVNKPGAGTVAASKYVLDGRNDGYTLYSTSTSSMMIAPVVNKGGYSWKDFIGIAQVMWGADAFWVRTDFEGNTIEKFIEYAKQNPGKIKYASPGVGTINQLGMEGFAAVKGISIKHIPTQGDAGAITAIVGGHVVAASGNAISYQPHADAGKIKCLAQFGGVRDKIFMPNIPTFKEMGIDVVADLWRWIVVPKGVAPERVKILAEAFQKALQDKETLSSLEKIQCPVSYIPPEGYAKVMGDSEGTILPLIKVAKLDK